MQNNEEQLLSAFFRKLEQRDALTQEERQALVDAAAEVRVVPAGRDISRTHERPTSSTLLVKGLTARYNLLEDGGRQITAFHIDGDFVDLHGFLLKTMDHSVRTMSECTIVTFPHQALRRITERHAHLTRLLWLSTLLDSAIHRQWLVIRGRMPALNHMAHLLCEQKVRTRVVGLATGDRFPFPITQSDLADAMGISAVHVNRTLQELRSMELVEWTDGWVAVPHEKKLRRMAGFDETYLHLKFEPR